MLRRNFSLGMNGKKALNFAHFVYNTTELFYHLRKLLVYSGTLLAILMIMFGRL